MAILTYDDIKNKLRSNAPEDFRRAMAAQDDKCAACGRDQSKWVTPSEFGPQFTDSIMEGAAHELICCWCVDSLRFEMHRTDNVRRIKAEMAAREEYVAAQIARYTDDNL